MANEKGRLWFHVASVGEFNTAKPILRKMYGDYHITLTYFSFRAGGYLRNQHHKGYFHQLYRLPPDLPPLVMSFENRIKPNLIIIMEREFWPSLLLFTKAPKLLLNAYAKGGFLERVLSKKFSLIVARAEKDGEAFKAYRCQKVIVCGNLKFVLEEPPPATLRVQDGDFLVVGSTHRGEELLVRDLFQKLRKELESLKLVVAPRHVKRAREVAKLFEGFRVSLRSREEDGWDVLVVDTLGELFPMYAHAKVALVGGTFVPVGGHNLLEPAYFGKPVIYGPYTQKVEDLRLFLEERGLGFCVKDATELYKKVRELLLKGSDMGGFTLREYSQRVLDCYASAIKSQLP
ncbi:MAG: 3-deoxy-D-manno-octulosonic acid transferase [Aquificaceae bacterium]|nr:3-deoxy-D-manno-octulosonic acid transferase [Aquificaceae bacterium]